MTHVTPKYSRLQRAFLLLVGPYLVPKAAAIGLIFTQVAIVIGCARIVPGLPWQIWVPVSAIYLAILHIYIHEAVTDGIEAGMTAIVKRHNLPCPGCGQHHFDESDDNEGPPNAR